MNVTIDKQVLKYSFISVLIFILNSAFTTNYSIMLVLTGLELFVLFVLFLKGNDLGYLCFYIIFITASMEFGQFVGTDEFYGFKNFKLLGINIAVWSIMPLFVKFIFTSDIISLFHKRKSYVKTFIIVISSFTLIATMTGLINILINDNNVGNFNSVLSVFLDATYIFFYILICILVVGSVINKYKENIDVIKKCLLSIFMGFGFSIFFTILTGTFGNYGGLDSLRVSNLVMLFPLFLVIPFFGGIKKRINIFLILISVTVVLFALYYNANGKMILLTLAAPFLILILLYRNQKKLPALILTIMFPIFIIAFISLVFYQGGMSRILSIKIEQTFSLLAIWRPDWLESMNGSPKARIAEFLNICLEYYQKPYYLITGKGYLGSIRDHLNMFGNMSLSGFSYIEWINGSFYKMHETLNNLFLANGLLGIAFYIYIIKLLFTKYHISEFLMVGSIWFLLFYGYSVTLAMFGVACLIVGLYELDKDILL